MAYPWVEERILSFSALIGASALIGVQQIVETLFETVEISLQAT